MKEPENIEDIVSASAEQKLDFLRRIAQIPSWEGNYDALYRELLDDECAEVRRMCLSAFWESGGVEDMDRIMEIASSDPDPSVRAEACSTLGIYVYEAFVLEELDPSRYETLREFLMGRLMDETESHDVRRFALESLGFDTGGDVADVLEWAYGQSEETWQASAVFAMGRSTNDRWAQHIVAALDSESRMVRLAAVKAASEGYCAEATPKLRNFVHDGDREIRLEAIWALGRAGGPGALEVLEFCATSDDEDVREMARGAVEEYAILKTGEDGFDDAEFGEDSTFDPFETDWEPGDTWDPDEPSDEDWLDRD